MEASERERPKPLPNMEPPPALSFGGWFSSAGKESALKVVPSTKGEEPRPGWSAVFFAREGNEVSLSLGTLAGTDPNPPLDLDAKMLGVSELAPSDPKPPLLAKPAKPPVPEASMPKAFPVLAGVSCVCAALPNPDCPNAGPAVGEEAVAQGDALMPIPMTEAWPKAGAAGLLPNGDPKADDAKDGLAAPAGAFPKEGVPKDGAAAAPEEDAHGEGLAPRAEVPPKAGAVLCEVVVADPNAEAVPAGVANAGATVAPVGAGRAGEAGDSPLRTARPLYVVPERIESL